MVYTIEERQPGALVVSISGRISVENGEHVLIAAIETALASRPRQVIVDLGEVASIDSCGLGELAASYSRARQAGCHLRVARANSRVLELLRVTRLATFLVEPSRTAFAGEALA